MHEASNKLEDIERWERYFYDFNILIKTKESGLVVIDYDIGKCRLENWQAVRRLLPTTFVVRSGSGGEHHYLLNKGRLDFHKDSMVPGIDIRGSNDNHVLAYRASLHATGELYSTLVNFDIADVPDAIVEAIRKERIVSVEYSSPGSTFVEILFEECGRSLGTPKKSYKGQYITKVLCPLSDTHSGNHDAADDSSAGTISGKGVGSYGRFVCFHEAHGGHGSIKTREAVRLLQIENPEAYERALARCDMKPKDLSHLPRVHKLKEAEKLLQETIFGAKQGKVTAVKVSTATGKTRTLALDVAQRASPADIYLPNHSLAKQVTETLRSLGVGVAHLRGVSSSNLSAEYRCAYPNLVKGAQLLRLPMRQSICMECPLMRDCRAFKDSDGKQDVRVMMHSILAEGVKSSKAERFYVDEMFPLLDKIEVSKKSLEDLFMVLKNLGEEQLNPYKQLVDLVVKAIPSASNKRYFTLREIVGISVSPDNQMSFTWNPEVDSMLHKIRTKDLTIPDDVKARLASKGRTHQEDFVKFSECFALVRALRRAAIHCDRRTFQVVDDKIVLQLPTEALDVMRERALNGSTTLLLSATLPDSILKSLLPDNLEILDVFVEDGENVSREFIYDKLTSRTHLCPNGKVNAENVRELVKKVYQDIVSNCVQDALIITFKPVAAWLRENDSALKAAVDSGAIDIAHYGAVVGLNRWERIGCVYTVGMPIPNLDAMRAEAEILGVPVDDYIEWKVDSEIIQATGRARSCRRTDKLRIIHRGTRVPSSNMDPNWWV
jgi:Bifunctional DNA primase/polymerase, N-terminal